MPAVGQEQFLQSRELLSPEKAGMGFQVGENELAGTSAGFDQGSPFLVKHPAELGFCRQTDTLGSQTYPCHVASPSSSFHLRLMAGRSLAPDASCPVISEVPEGTLYTVVLYFLRLTRDSAHSQCSITT